MERSAKTSKVKVEAKRSVARKALENQGEIRELEKRLAEALEQRAEALEQQTATSEILQVISSSLGDVQPVLNAVAERAAILCDAPYARVVLVDGELLRPMADYSAERDFLPQPSRPMPLKRTVLTGRAILDRATIHHADVMPLLSTEYPDSRESLAPLGPRAVLVVPLMREGGAYGGIVLFRREPRLFSSGQVALVQTFARQAAIAIDNARLFKETKDGLEQQTAVSDILRVIASFPGDVKPILDAVAERMLKLCDAAQSGIFLIEGNALRFAARFGSMLAPMDNEYFPLSRGLVVGRAAIDRETVHCPDIVPLLDKEYPDAREPQQRFGFRALLAVPLMHNDRAIGAIVLWRTEVGPFDERQIALVKTFADQAAIAIENVRLFNETKEALERQTATSEILRVISQSPTDVQPVFDAIVAAAMKLCHSPSANVFTFDGELIHLMAFVNVNPDYSDAIRLVFPRAPGRDTAAGRAILTRKVVIIPNVLEDREYGIETQSLIGGYRSLLAVPLLREQKPIGAIIVGGGEPGDFPDKQIALLQTFADQAVIAIENARLFNETKEALEQQTATSEILRVISTSPTDVQPVFNTIATNALRLCGARFSAIFRFDGELIHIAAFHNINPVEAAGFYEAYPCPPGRGGNTQRSILTRSVVHLPDVLKDPEYIYQQAATRANFRSALSVPMLRDGQPVGAISVFRAQPRPFPDTQIELLKTFAEQAVIAIENVRLFAALEARTNQLTRSVGELNALGEVGQAVSSTLELETVLKTIVSRAVQLTGLDGGSIYEYDEGAEEFRLQAAENMPQDIADDIRKAPTRKGDGALGRTAITLEPTQVPDTVDDSYQSVRKDVLIRAGYRALLAVPLLRESHLLGGLLVNRKTPGPFPPETVELLKNFATQSAVAIHNARLFREIADKGRQLETASRHKSDFLASMSHELRTPLNAILGFNEMILGEIYGEVPANMKEPLEDIQTSGKHLLRLINNVLDLAKIEAGRMELALVDYSVQDTVESVRTTLRPLAADKGLEFVASVPADVPLAYGDPGRITQCLMNLAGNSLKFTKKGKVEISVATRGPLLIYRVTDTGIGIPPDKLDSVFAEFKQTDATIASEYGGTGLGLSISRKFVEMHGGRIWVESELGKGSTFVFEIPLRAAPAVPS